LVLVLGTLVTIVSCELLGWLLWPGLDWYPLSWLEPLPVPPRSTGPQAVIKAATAIKLSSFFIAWIVSSLR
jgi:hypothetical protein